MDLQTYTCYNYGWADIRPSGLKLIIKLAKGSLEKLKRLGNKLNRKCEKIRCARIKSDRVKRRLLAEAYMEKYGIEI